MHALELEMQNVDDRRPAYAFDPYPYVSKFAHAPVADTMSNCERGRARPVGSTC